MSLSAGRVGPVTWRSGSHARIGRSRNGGVVTHHARAAARVVLDPDHAVEAVAHLLDVRDENDLREAIAQPTQQADDVLAAGLVPPGEVLIPHPQRPRRARPPPAPP